MTVVGIIDEITAWARAEICEKVKLKMPPEDDENNGAHYEYQTVTPACFSLFVPSKDKLPPSVLSPIPSLCVRVLEGEDDLTVNNGRITVEFAFSTWSTGTHGQDILYPDENDHSTVKQWTGQEAEAYFKANANGWRDAWNWIDVALRAIESTLTINGIEIDRSAGVKFYPFKEQESIPDFYPFWFTGIQFKVNRPLIRNIPEIQDLL